jgi:hypothetical protein
MPKVVSVELPDDMYLRLLKAKDEMHVSVNSLLRRMIGQFLDELCVESADSNPKGS